MEQKYYFISYYWRTACGTKELSNQFIDVHPFEFLKEYYCHSEQGRLVNWWEVTKEEYEHYRGYIG